MVLQARLTFSHRACYSQTLADGAMAAQITRDEDRDVYVMHATGPAQIDEYLGRMEPVFGDSLEVLARDDRAVLYRGANPPHATVAAILREGCSVLWPVVFGNGRQQLTILAPDRQRLEALLRRLEELGEPTLDQVRDVTPESLTTNVSLADFVGGLTARQVAVLSVAIAEGYYETPRRVGLDDIARRFQISRSTVHEHLRKAERGVLRQVGVIFSAFAPNLAHATKKMGRPPSWRARRRR